MRGCDLATPQEGEQLLLFEDLRHHERLEKLEASVDRIRDRFGHAAIRRAAFLKNDGQS